MAAGKEFHQNVFLLTQAIPPSEEFAKHFKQGMFDKANSMGFIHVAHYLLTIYDENRWNKYIEWPILDKITENKYRNGAIEFMTLVFKENEDIDCPTILKSHLVAPHGRIINNLMRSLSQIVLRTYLRRVGIHVLEAPKSEQLHPLAEVIINKVTNDHTKDIQELDKRYSEIEEKAKEQAIKISERIESVQSDLFKFNEILHNVALKSNVRPDIKKRLVDCSDLEVVQLWTDHIENVVQYLEQLALRVKVLEQQSEKVNNLVQSLFSEDRKILTGKDLPKIDISNLMELPLHPEAQVALHHLYVDNNLDLANMFILTESMLRYYHEKFAQIGFSDVSDYIQQIEVSMEDLQSMCIVIGSQNIKIAQMLDAMKSNHKLKGRQVYAPAFYAENYDIFDSILLKASPKATIDIIDRGSVTHDIQKRLDLTPGEDQHKALFTRYQKKDYVPLTTPTRPKIMVSRINFDDTILSGPHTNLGAIPKRLNSPKPAKYSQSSIEERVGKKFARLFNTGSSGMTLNNSGKALSSTVIEGHNSRNIYNMSDLRAQLANTSSVSMNLEVPVFLGRSSQNTSANRSSLILKDLENPAMNSTAVGQDLKTIRETAETNLAPVLINTQSESEPGPQKSTRHRGRRSLKDLLDRYKKIRDRSITIPPTGFDDDDD